MYRRVDVNDLFSLSVFETQGKALIVIRDRLTNDPRPGQQATDSEWTEHTTNYAQSLTMFAQRWCLLIHYSWLKTP